MSGIKGLTDRGGEVDEEEEEEDDDDDDDEAVVVAVRSMIVGIRFSS